MTAITRLQRLVAQAQRQLQELREVLDEEILREAAKGPQEADAQPLDARAREVVG